MTRIGFIETSTHEQVLYYLLRAANTSNNEVTVFTTDPIAEEVQDLLGSVGKNVEWVTTPQDGSVRKLLGKAESYSENLDVLIIQPLYHNMRDLFYYSRFTPACPTALWLFNVNTWLRSRPSLNMGLRGSLRTVMHRYIADSSDAYFVEYPPMSAYVSEEVGVSKVKSFVPTLYEPSDNGKSSEVVTEQIRIIIPGNVSPDRRNYELALDAFERAATPGGVLELRIQGQRVGPVSDCIYERCKRLRDDGYKVTWSKEWTPLAEFHNNIEQSDMILAPLRANIDVLGTTEMYGRSKGSGSISDALRNGVPILLPRFFPVDELMGEGARYYSDVESLTNHLQTLRDNPDELTEFKTNARKAAREYTLDRQQERFASVLTELFSE